MKFEEKLQKMRKDKGLSQEQLAEQLGVTRQSVSKWESGQSYPEMDKLLLICKLFDCTLDELTNDKIRIDDVKEQSKLKKGTKFVNSFLNDVNRSIDKFKTMSNSEIKRCFIELLVIVLILTIIHSPLSDILHNSYFNNYGFFSSIWIVIVSLIDFAYFILSIFIILYIFKTRYLDKDEVKEELEVKEDNIKKVNEKEVADAKEDKLFNPWKMIVIGFIKFMLVCIALPITFSILGLFIAFFVILFLVLSGISLFGPLIILFSLIIAFGALSELLWGFIFKTRVNYKKVLVIFVIFSLFFSVGSLFATIETTKYTYYNSLPSDINSSTISKQFTYSTNYYLGGNLFNYENTSYIIDNTLGDQLLVRVTYYSSYMAPSINLVNDKIKISGFDGEFNISSKSFNEITKYLKEYKIYNYSKLYEVKIEVLGNAQNINNLKYTSNNEA